MAVLLLPRPRVLKHARHAAARRPGRGGAHGALGAKALAAWSRAARPSGDRQSGTCRWRRGWRREAARGRSSGRWNRGSVVIVHLREEESGFL